MLVLKSLIVLLISFFSITPAALSLSQAEETVLDSGATVVTRHIPNAEVTVIKLSVLSGLSNEGKYAGTGISHLVEHLIFKGTEDKTDKEFFDKVREIGGVINGFTGLDSVGYHITVPNEHFAEALELIVDLVMQFEFDEEDFRKEREVIIREMEMHHDNASRRLSQGLYSRAFLQHLYRFPIIGYIDRFKTLTEKDARKYHASNYTPDKIVLGIAGGADPGEMIEVASSALEKYERGEAWIPQISTEPPQRAQRRAVKSFDMSLGRLAIGFHSTSMFSDDVYAMNVLSILLGRGRDSRLHQRLIRDKELLYSVSASNQTPRYPGLFVITGQGEPENIEKAEEEIFAVIEELKRTGVEERELERAKNMVSSSFISSSQGTHNIASTITRSQLLTGAPDFLEGYVENIQKVTREDVEDVLERYLIERTSTVVRMYPEEYLKEEVHPKREEKLESEPVTIETLPNGMKVILKRRPSFPLVSANISFRGGSRAEDRERSGISNLTSGLLLKGTEKRTEEEIVPVFEHMGGSISSTSAKNSLGLSMQVLSKDVEKAFEIFSDVVKNPSFPEEELDKERDRVIASIRESEKEIVPAGTRRMNELLYGDHPYHMPRRGTVETVESFTREDLLAFHQEHVRPDSAVISVVGDIDKDEIMDILERNFDDFEGFAEELPRREIERLEEKKTDQFRMDRQQAMLLLGFQSVDQFDTRKYALAVLDNMLSGGGGILFRRIREERGLAYSTGAASRVSVEGGHFQLRIMTSEENLPEAREHAKKVLREIKRGEFSDKEFQSGKMRVLTSLAASFETNSSLASAMTTHELAGLGYDYLQEYPDKVRAVTREDIEQAAREILDLERYVEVVVLPESSE